MELTDWNYLQQKRPKMIRPFLLVSVFDFFLEMRNVRLFDHLIVINDDWGRFTKIHTFSFDDLEFALMVPGLD
jgi:hypothetical protein